MTRPEHLLPLWSQKLQQTPLGRLSLLGLTVDCVIGLGGLMVWLNTITFWPQPQSTVPEFVPELPPSLSPFMSEGEQSPLSVQNMLLFSAIGVVVANILIWATCAAAMMGIKLIHWIMSGTTHLRDEWSLSWRLGFFRPWNVRAWTVFAGACAAAYLLAAAASVITRHPELLIATTLVLEAALYTTALRWSGNQAAQQHARNSSNPALH